jgi:hypothetical protein
MTTRSSERNLSDLDVSNLGQGLNKALTQKRRQVEADSWWWVVSLALMATGVYLLLAAHLILDVIHASALVWAAWLAVPVAFFVGAGLALGAEAGFSLREQARAVPAVLLGSAPVGSRPKETSSERQAAQPSSASAPD